MDIHAAIRNSKLSKLQKDIDKCNNKNGCNHYCNKEEQKNCEKLKAHRNEVSNLKYDT
jgi:hypothetical protein